MRTAYPIVTLGRFARCSIVSCGNPLINRLSGLWDGLLAGGRVVWKGPLCALCLHVRLAGKGRTYSGGCGPGERGPSCGLVFPAALHSALHKQNVKGEKEGRCLVGGGYARCLP